MHNKHISTEQIWHYNTEEAYRIYFEISRRDWESNHCAPNQWYIMDLTSANVLTLSCFLITSLLFHTYGQSHHEELSLQKKYMDPKIYWELNWLSQWDPKLVKFIKDEILISPTNQSPNLLNEFNPNQPWNHQGGNGEAMVVETIYNLERIKRISDRYRNTPGDSKNQFFFIEAGALDGETLSNTLYLELKYNWTGLLVEPNPWLVSLLRKKKRNAWILPHCLSPTKAPVVVKFDAMGEYGGIINNERKETKMPGNINSNNTRGWLGPMWRRTIEVQCFPIYSILQALGGPEVHYFSLDIEGSEYQVLKSIPFEVLNIKMLGIETVHAGKVFGGTEEDIMSLLRKNGYQYVAKTKFDKFFRKKTKQKITKRLKIITVS